MFYLIYFIGCRSNAYLEAVEIVKEGKALPRWVENVVITASKIKGCSLDGDDEDNEEDGEEEEETEAAIPVASPEPSTQDGKTKIYL